jgi:hypothetical protein
LELTSGLEIGAQPRRWPRPPEVFAKITWVLIPHTLLGSKSRAKVGPPDSAENTEEAKAGASI